MAVPLRFDQLTPDRQSKIRANLATMEAQHAPDTDIETYLRDLEHIVSVEEQQRHANIITRNEAGKAKDAEEARPGVVARTTGHIGDFLGAVRNHPADVIKGLVTAPVKSALDAVLTPEVGEARPDPKLVAARFGGIPQQPAPPYDAEHGAQPKGGRTLAGLQTVANIAFPGIASGVGQKLVAKGIGKGFSGIAGMAAGAAPAGAAYSPDDPLAGALAGSVIAGGLGAMHAGVSKIARKSVRDFGDMQYFDPADSQRGAVAKFFADKEGAKIDERERVNQFITDLKEPSRIPATVDRVAGLDVTPPKTVLARQPRKVAGLETEPFAGIEDATGRRKLTPLETEPVNAPLQEAADLSAAVTPDPALLAALEELRPKRRAASRVAIEPEVSPVKVDADTGLPLNDDGTVTLYHHTNKSAAEAIRKSGRLISAAEPDVYLTTHAVTDTGYGDTAVPIRVRPQTLLLDDEFPGGRKDYRIPVGKKGLAVRVDEGFGREPAPKSRTPKYPEGFSMGGDLKSPRIPAKSELPKVAKGSDIVPNLPEGVTPESVALANSMKSSKYRKHTVEQLAEEALDTQSAIEAAQKAQQDGTYRTANRALAGSDAAAEQFEIGRGEPREQAAAFEDATTTHDKALAAAMARAGQIERELAYRGVSSDKLADLMEGAKERRFEREGMQGEPPVADDPFGEGPEAVSGDVPRGTLEPVEGTGDLRTRGNALSTDARAIEAGLEPLGDLPQYRQMSKADQAEKALNLLQRDPELARRIATGHEAPPKGVLPESVFLAVRNKAVAEGDVATLRDIANGELTTEATEMGRRISMLNETDPTDPVAAMQGVIRAREKAAPSSAKQVSTVVSQIKSGLAKLDIAPKDWATFVDSLRCP